MEIYEPLNQSLKHVGSLMDAAETHGILCGLLCVSESFSENIWITHVLGETSVQDGLASQCQQQLHLVKNYTIEQLESANYEFMPLLPDDDISLVERTQALGGWCEGFLFGFSLTKNTLDDLSDNTKEFIDDMISVSHIAPTETSENNEENYMQVVEYIKVGVISCYDSK